MKPYPARVMNLSKILHCDSSSINIIYDEGAIGIDANNTALLANEEVAKHEDDMTSNFSQLTSRSRSISRDSKKRNTDCLTSNNDLVDLTIDRSKRRLERKNKTKMKRSSENERRDPVYVVDLHAIPDFDRFFKTCINENMTLNVKGPLANLHFDFHAVDERPVTESSAADGIITSSSECLHRKAIYFY
jgi:hypothetical protein